MKSYDRAKSAAQRGHEQRTRIVAAATETYAAKGYQATTIGDICVRAKMSRRTVYAHFPTLDALRFAVFEAALQATLIEVGRVAMEPSSADRLESVLRLAFGQIVTMPNLARVVTYELRRPEARNVEVRQRILSFFVHVWLEAHAYDVAKEPAPYAIDELTLYGLLGAVEGMAVRYLDTNQEAKALEAVPVLLSIVRGIYPFRQAQGLA